MSARSIVEEKLGPPRHEEVDVVTVQVSGEGAGNLRKFLKQVERICNGGSSRSVVIEHPADEAERECHWDFDGDGNTKIEVLDSGEVSEALEPVIHNPDGVGQRYVDMFKKALLVDGETGEWEIYDGDKGLGLCAKGSMDVRYMLRDPEGEVERR